MFFIAWVNTFRRIACKKVNIEFQSRDPFQNRYTFIFRYSWVNRRFVNNDGAPLHIFSDDPAGADERRKIGLMSKVYRGGNCDNNIISVGQLGWIGSNRQVTCRLQIIKRNFAGWIYAALVTVDFAAGKIISYGSPLFSKFNCQG